MKTIVAACMPLTFDCRVIVAEINDLNLLRAIRARDIASSCNKTSPPYIDDILSST